jgi:hypothetical protein
MIECTAQIFADPKLKCRVTVELLFLIEIAESTKVCLNIVDSEIH